MSPAPKNIFALFVAIDQYPEGVNPLFGCVNDYKALCEFLHAHFNNGQYKFQPKALTNEEAGRSNIIAAFTHFEQAKDGDICLFFYSGHGAQRDAPAEFRELESDGKMEAIVCYDSRQAGGRDLMDKELAYLIWKSKAEKNVHFLVIMDCCHANNNTRAQEDGIRLRSLEGHPDHWPAQSYLGFPSFKEVSPGKFSPPRTTYVQLSACDSHEEAREVFVGGQNQGIFTYALLEALRSCSGRISYQQLMKKIKVAVRKVTKQQLPVMSSSLGRDKWTAFLGGDAYSPKTTFTVFYERDLGWVVDGGQLHAFCGGADNNATQLKLTEGGYTVRVDKAGPVQSTLAGMPADLSRRNRYEAKVTANGIAALTVAFAPDIPEIARLCVEQEKARMQEMGICLVSDLKLADYWIAATEEALFLCRAQEGRPLFGPVQGFSQESALDLVDKLETVANWLFVEGLQNPHSEIDPNVLKLELYRLTESGNYEDDAPAELVPISDAIPFPYLYEDGKWRLPGFRFRITNTGLEKLYLSVAYMSYDYGITNQLMAYQPLAPGEGAWLLEETGGYSYKTIRLQLEDAYHEYGITQATGYLKVFVGTEPLDTDIYNRDGLPFAEPGAGPYRSVSLRNAERQADWMTMDVEFQLFRPMRLQSLNSHPDFRVGDLRLSAPQGFRAQVKAANEQEWRLALGLEHIGLMPDGQFMLPAVFQHQMHYAGGLFVVEFFDAGNEPEKLVLGHPLLWRLPQSWAGKVTPVDYDQKRREFVVIPHRWKGAALLLEELPAETPTYPHAFGASRKVMLHQTATFDV